jgi:hypothetical protein
VRAAYVQVDHTVVGLSRLHAPCSCVLSRKKNKKLKNVEYVEFPLLFSSIAQEGKRKRKPLARADPFKL